MSHRLSSIGKAGLVGDPGRRSKVPKRKPAGPRKSPKPPVPRQPAKATPKMKKAAREIQRSINNRNFFRALGL